MSLIPVTVSFDKEKLERFKVKQFDNELAGRLFFRFEGMTYATDYAKYVIEYLEGKLK